MQAVGIFAAMPTQAVPSPLAWRGEDFFRERPPRPYCGTPPRAWVCIPVNSATRSG